MKAWVLIGAVALVAAAPPASAQILSQVVPVKYSLTLQPGKPVSRDVDVTNLSGEPAVVRVRLSDWTMNDDGRLDLAPRGSTPQTIDSLVEFEPREFSLQPGETGRIHLTARMPAGGLPTRWGVLLSEVRPAVARPGGFGPRALVEMGTTLYLSRVPPEESHAQLTGMSILPAGGDSVTLSLRVRNSGERQIYVAGQAAITDAAGKQVASGALPSGVVLPGRVRHLTWKCPAGLPPGSYHATASLDTGEPDLLVGETGFRWHLSPTIATAPAR